MLISEAEFCQRNSDDREEFVDGEVVAMSPESLDSEQLRWFLGRLLLNFVEAGDLGIVCGPNFQIRLRQGLRRIPDLLFIHRDHAHRVHPTYLEGAPDMALEVVSADSHARDWREKYLEYQQGGVAEYWVVDPLYRRAELYRLAEDRFVTVPAESGWLCSAVVPGFHLKVEWLWMSPLPKLQTALSEPWPLK